MSDTKEVTTEQVVQALKDRKSMFLHWSTNQPMETEDRWIFNHVCTVLDHAVKIMERPDEDFEGDHNMFMS